MSNSLSYANELPLFRLYPSLKKTTPHIQLLSKATEVAPLRGLEKELYRYNGYDAPLDPRLLIKRDDAPGEILGGNKARKLEFLLADAKRVGATTLETSGMWGSNHALAVTLAAKSQGMKARLVLGPQPVTDDVRKKLLAFHALGAEMTYCSNKVSMGVELAKQSFQSWFGSKKNYLIAPGGSDTIGSLGYINAYLELYEQLGPENMPEEIVVPVGSMGTAAGLIVGSCLAGTWEKVRIVGVGVADSLFTNEISVLKHAIHLYHSLRDRMDLADRERIPHCDIYFNRSSFTFLTEYLDPGYGAATSETQEIVKSLRQSDGIELEATYSGKAMLALTDRWRTTFKSGHFPKKTLFWLTYRAHNLDEIINGAQWTDANAKYKDLPKSFHHLFE